MMLRFVAVPSQKLPNYQNVAVSNQPTEGESVSGLIVNLLMCDRGVHGVSTLCT